MLSIVKQYKQNRTFQNNERKFYQQLGGDDTKTYQKPKAEETERFRLKYSKKIVTKMLNTLTIWQEN